MWKLDYDDVFDLLLSFPADENGFMNDAWDIDRRKVPEYLDSLHDMSRGVGLRDGYVPMTKYALVNDAGELVGIFNIRHRLTKQLRNGAGHIGYGIAPAYRNRGYATEGLRLCLDKAKDIISEDVVLMSALKSNSASLAVQMKNGARIDHEDEQDYFTTIPLPD